MSAAKTLSDITSPEFERLGASVALLPVGATEQHGPNLAMGVDWRIAEALSLRICESVYPKAVVLPALPYGISGHHMAFPGTITLSAETFMVVLSEIASSLKRHGIRKLVVVNGHRGNEAALRVVATKLTYEVGVETATAFWLTQGGDVIERATTTHRWGHACEIETSLAMELTADLVRADALEPGDLIEDYGPYEDNYEAFALNSPRSFASRTRNGVFGDARQATKEIGAEISEAVVRRVSEFVAAFAEREPHVS